MKGYPLNFAACRDLGHTWFYISWKGNKREVLCNQCTTKRFDTLAGFRVVKRSYRYPKDYRNPGVAAFEAAIDARRRLMKMAQSSQIRWLEQR